MKAMKVQAVYKCKLKRANHETNRIMLTEHMAETTQATLLQILCGTTFIDILGTIYETCQMVFFDQSVNLAERKYRADSVRELGIIFQECPEPESSQHTRDVETLYEDAVFAALLETIKRREDI